MLLGKMFKTCETNGLTIVEKIVSRFFSLFLSVGCSNNHRFFIYLNKKRWVTSFT